MNLNCLLSVVVLGVAQKYFCIFQEWYILDQMLGLILVDLDDSTALSQSSSQWLICLPVDDPTYWKEKLCNDKISHALAQVA